MDAVILSRLQFALTIGFHILWPTFSIGIACFVACLSGLWWRTWDTVYRDLMRFWRTLFALAFGMGVITGIVLSYEIGTNWAGYSRSVANVLGPLFMYEALTAFFLEAGFIGIMLFGEQRVGRGVHFFACCMVASGTLLSATWIIAANSWMQTPAGATADANGIFHVTDWLDVIFNPSFPYRLLHMVCASFLTGSFVVAGVSALQAVRHGRAHSVFNGHVGGARPRSHANYSGRSARAQYRKVSANQTRGHGGTLGHRQGRAHDLICLARYETGDQSLRRIHPSPGERLSHTFLEWRSSGPQGCAER